MAAADTEILIYGAGGQAMVVYDAILAQAKFRAAGFIVDDRPVVPNEKFLGVAVYHLEQIDELSDCLPRNFIVGIGDNDLRRQRQEAMVARGFRPVTVVHPFSRVGCWGGLGDGVLICGGATIDPDVEIGDGALINGGAMIGHGSRLGRFVHHSAGAALGGSCHVGDGSFIGMGAIVLSGLSVGRNAFVAAGALVTKNVPDDTMAIGMPARFRRREPLASSSER